MTPEQFDIYAARCNRQFRDGRSCSAARRVLVDGLGITEAGNEAGLQKQAVHRAVARIEREHRATVGCPPGWVVITVCVPPAEPAFAVRSIERNEWKKAGLIV